MEQQVIDSLQTLRVIIDQARGMQSVLVFSVEPRHSLRVFDFLIGAVQRHGWVVPHQDLARLQALYQFDRVLAAIEGLALPRLALDLERPYAAGRPITDIRHRADSVGVHARMVGGSIRAPGETLRDRLFGLATAAEQAVTDIGDAPAEHGDLIVQIQIDVLDVRHTVDALRSTPVRFGDLPAAEGLPPIDYF
ncbi:hypothetical protein ACP4OV_025585 [Aristida adscensionis]